MPVQNKPIIHGRDHETDGADPIRGLIPQSTGSYMERVLAEPSLVAYWPLSDTSAPALDVSGHDRHLTDETGAPEYSLEGPFPASIYPDAVFFNGTHGDSSTVESLSRADAAFLFTSGAPFTLEIYVYAQFTGATGYSSPVYSALTLGAPPSVATIAVTGYGAHAGEASLYGVYSDGVTLNEETWVHVAATYDGTDVKLYFDAALVGTGLALDAGIGGGKAEVGSWNPTGVETANWAGRLAHGAVYSEALTQAQLANHVGSGDGNPPPGWVLTPDPDNPGGPPIWAPPGTETEHGDGPEQENPSTGPSAGGATNGSGWHYEDHFEYVVLYDSNPGRFDVPPRKWVRVPFNTVRIQRRWETEPGLFKDAWLEDDRGLTEHAKQGVLLVTPGMLFDQPPEISGWYSVEYPMLDWTQLPEFDDPGPIEYIDYYVRAARMTNTTTGQVLRAGDAWPDNPGLRVYHDWPFSTPADGDLGPVFRPSDNPYPRYVYNAARPLNKPLPYPKKNNADSLDDYKSLETDRPGFDVDSWSSRATRAAGDAISLQAWQDSPWTLRFGTDKYPPYTPPNYREVWRKRPGLVLYHRYDPDTVDHDTGLLL